MSEEILKGKWKQLAGKIMEKWSQLTEEDLKKVNGQKDKLIGLLEEKYGWAKVQAEEEVKKFYESHKELVQEIEGNVSQTLQNTCSELKKYIKQSPLQAVGIAAGLGVLLSALIRR